MEKHAERTRNGRHTDPFSTVQIISTMRFDHGVAGGSCATDEELELPQVSARALQIAVEGFRGRLTMHGDTRAREAFGAGGCEWEHVGCR